MSIENSYSAIDTYPKFSLLSLEGKWPECDCIVELDHTRGMFGVSACDSMSVEELDSFGNGFRHRYEGEFAALDARYSFILINNATIVGDTGAILNESGDLLLESLFPSFRPKAFKVLDENPAYSKCRDSRTFDEDVFVLFDGGGFKNYWHFHVDMLPTVLFTQETKLPGPIKLAVPKRSHWHSAALAKLDVEEREVIELQNAFNKFRRICLFSSVFWPELTVPNSLARKTFRRLKGKDDFTHADSKTATPKLLYVARTDSTARRMLNEQDLVAKLKSLGFEIATMSNLSYEEQSLLFRSSDVVVSPHGAGLTNIVYCKTNTLVVEIMPYGILNAPHYNFLSKTLGLAYEMFISRIPSDVSVHERWTLEVETFLFRLLCILFDYGFADREHLIAKLSGSRDDKTRVLLGEYRLRQLFESNAVVLYGFSGMEVWGCWVCERRAAMHFRLPLPTSFILSMKIAVHMPALSKQLVISCGTTQYNVSSSADEIAFRVDNPAQCRTIWIDAPGAISPAKASGQPTADRRLLSIGISAICIEQIKPARKAPLRIGFRSFS